MEYEKNRSGRRRQKKKREKTILRVLRSCAFSHSLDPQRTRDKNYDWRLVPVGTARLGYHPISFHQ
jgi:hypothetical protein